MRRSVISFLVLFALLGCVFIAGCTGDSGEATPAPTQTPTPTETVIADPVATFKVEKMRIDIFPGEYIKCVLPSNPTTGYDWIVVEDPEQTVTSNYIADANAAGLAGAGGVTEFLIQVQKPGAYKFVANYARSWETDVDPIAVFSQVWMVSAVTETTETNPILAITADGKVSPSPGEVIKVTIEGNPTTGYEWDLAEGTQLKVLSKKYTPYDSDGMVGAGGVYEWLLTADAPGLYEIGGEYKRSFEEDAVNMFWFNVVYI